MSRHPSAPIQRRPSVGDHVTICGGYVGLIVDCQPGGIVTVARRHASGRTGVLESDMLADRLQVAAMAPVGFDEALDDEWRRGKLG